eukprot:2683703-Alexandrium_andersonii.AAC.1
MQIQAPEAPREARRPPREARRLRRLPLKSGAPTTFADSEPRRGAFGLLGELGPRPPTEGWGQNI